MSKEPSYDQMQSETSSESKEAGFMKRNLQTTVYDTYAICASLLTGFTSSTYTMTWSSLDRELDPLRRGALITHQVLNTIAQALSIYPTLVFMLIAMYTKTALYRSQGFDAFDQYAQSTLTIRTTAFWFMMIAYSLFLAVLGLGLFISLDTKMALRVAAFFFFFALLAIYDLKQILDAGQNYVMRPKKNKEVELQVFTKSALKETQTSGTRE